MAESVARYVRKMALLAKMEVTHGVDPVPTGNANAMQVSDVRHVAIEGDDVSRELVLPYMGAQGMMLTGEYGSIEFSVEVAGAGAAGTIPAYDPLLRACGLHRTIVEDEGDPVAVEYNPVSGGFESAALYYYLDGVRHILLACRGTVSISFVSKQIARYRFRLLGLLGTVSDTALPAVDYTDFIKPVPVNKANTALTLHGWTAVAESIELQLGNSVEPRMLIGEESIKITDRNATGTAVVQATDIATVNWFAKARSKELGAMLLQHGTVAGNIVKFASAGVEIGRPTEGQSQGIANASLPLRLIPGAGNDELIITVQ